LNVQGRRIKDFISLSKDFCKKLYEFINNADNFQYFKLNIVKTNLVERLKKMSQIMDSWFDNNPSLTKDFRMSFIRLSSGISSFFSWFNIFEEFVNNQKQSDKLVNKLKLSVEQAQAQAKNFETAINAINGEESEKIYSTASINFVDSARKYEVLFYLILGGAVLFTTVHLCYVPFKGNEVNFILVKILTFSLVLTLGTIFLRKAAHLRKLSDQAHQTSLELKALPLFLKNVDSEHHSEIYKDLAAKYFGKNVDQTQNDKIGDLMQDQLNAGTELIKASAEMLKAKSGSNIENDLK